jgi:hypothetical protein
MLWAEIVLFGFIFYCVYHFTDPNASMVKSAAPPRWKGPVLQQKLHKYRVQGVNRLICEDMMNELKRRGVPIYEIPQFDQGLPPEEVAAQLELMIEEVPYVPRDLQEPGEDKSIGRSTGELWPRPPEPEVDGQI